MPTYVYKFVDTGETIEVQQAFTDPSLTELAHPTDGMVRPVKKVFLPVGITFKGSGFYKTDSRNGKSSSSGSSSSSSSNGSSGESSGTKDTPAKESTGSTSGSSSSSASTASSTPATNSAGSGGGSTKSD